MKSYKDPGYDKLDAETTARLGLPEGLLAAIRTRGERSNADQVSEASAKTVYQIIPATRKAVEEKYGIDPWLSPENASLAAGYLLKESLQRNKGDIAAAVQEYHGGTDRKGWGSRTSAYLNRVMTALPAAAAPQGRRLSQEFGEQQAAAPSIAKVYDAYKAGQMAPEEAAEFEADVAAGRVLLPRGAEIKKAGAADPIQGVLNAYFDGRMSKEEAEEFKADVAAGRLKLPPGVQLEEGNGLSGTARASQIPGQDGQPVQVTTAPPATVAENIVGAGEAALSAVTGLTGGAAGMVAGTVGGVAGAVLSGQFGTPEGARQIEQAASDGAAALTYEPRTAAGQSQAHAVGQALQQVIPVVPVIGGVAGTARPAAQTAVSTAASARAAALQAVKQKVEAAAARRAQAANDPSVRPTPGTMGSVGAAGTDIATVRRMGAQELPAPIELTKGQAERTFEQQRFEAEMAKDPLKGQALRERAAEQHAQVWKNFDLWLDETGAQKMNLGEVGDTVTKALRERATADKARIRSAYKAAEKAGEMEQPVALVDAVNYLNENAPDAAVAKVLDAARARALRLDVAAEGAGGELVAQPVPLKTAELFRRAVSNATDFEPTNVRHSAQIKGLVDQATRDLGGNLYKEARGLRARYAQNYENIGLVYDLMNTKRGLSDMKVAAEDVFRRSVLNASMADVKQLRRILQTGGESGQQAWRELQGATIRHIRDEAAKNISRNERGQEMVSVKGLDSAIKGLDQSGKLDFIFGRRGAEQLRSLNDLSKVLFTAPPGAINTINTASVILAALDIATSGLAGIPAPVFSGLRILTTHVKDRQIQKRINEALGIKPEPKKVKAPQGIVPPAAAAATRVPESRTVH